MIFNFYASHSPFQHAAWGRVWKSGLERFTGNTKLGNVNPEPWPQCFSRWMKSRFCSYLYRLAFLLDTPVKIRKIINLPQDWFAILHKTEAKLAVHVHALCGLSIWLCPSYTDKLPSSLPSPKFWCFLYFKCLYCSECMHINWKPL